MGTIVVGVDGSEGSIGALRFALEEARFRGAELKAVNAWHIPPAVYGAEWAPTNVDLDEFRKLADSALGKSLDEAGAAGSGVTVNPVLREGQPADVLCAEAAQADLLVVGSRGLGGFRGLVLGSVSQQCAHHAPCPVVIVPAKHGEG
ncbi:MAG TPA: universal stress protein [Gaiellaceae bacterium]|nr:universal stress protein [Gaiellaceae bacterium]